MSRQLAATAARRALTHTKTKGNGRRPRLKPASAGRVASNSVPQQRRSMTAAATYTRVSRPISPGPRSHGSWAHSDPPGRPSADTKGKPPRLVSDALPHPARDLLAHDPGVRRALSRRYP